MAGIPPPQVVTTTASVADDLFRGGHAVGHTLEEAIAAARPRPPTDPRRITGEFVFQETFAQMRNVQSTFADPSRPGVVYDVYGVTHDGRSVLVHVHGYDAYVWVKVPRIWHGGDADALIAGINDFLPSKMRGDVKWRRGKAEEARDNVAAYRRRLPNATEKSDTEFAALCDAMRAATTGLGHALDAAKMTTTSARLARVDGVKDAQSVDGYQGDKKDRFIRIRVAHPALLRPLCRELARGVRIADNNPDTQALSARRRKDVPKHLREAMGPSGPQRQRVASFECFEGDFGGEKQFMYDSAVRGCGWVGLPKGTYTVRGAGGMRDRARIAHADVSIELDVHHWASMRALTADNDPKYATQAPTRVLSFDGEMAAHGNHFPSPDVDPVIQLGVTVQTFGGTDNEGGGDAAPVDVSFMLALKETAPLALGDDEGGANQHDDERKALANTHLIWFDREEDLLRAYAALVRRMDPDTITGYNTSGFDFPYLVRRAVALGMEALDFTAGLGRVVGEVTKLTERSFGNGANAKRTIPRANIAGRTQFDLLEVMLRGLEKRKSYTLASVAADKLDGMESKGDVHWSHIPILWRMGPMGRAGLARYCVQDARLVLLLIRRMCKLSQHVEMARVTGVDVQALVTGGELQKVMSLVIPIAHEAGFLFPNRKHGHGDGYEGAIVIEPDRGFWQCVTCLDFASLYPSIMISGNMCWSTRLPGRGSPGEMRRLGLRESDVTRAANGECFVRRHVRVGQMPASVAFCLGARRVAKNAKKAATTPFMRNVQDGRQLALKLAANAHYGLFGAVVSFMYSKEIAEAITLTGQRLIKLSWVTVEEYFREGARLPALADLQNRLTWLRDGVALDDRGGSAAERNAWRAKEPANPFTIAETGEAFFKRVLAHMENLENRGEFPRKHAKRETTFAYVDDSDDDEPKAPKPKVKKKAKQTSLASFFGMANTKEGTRKRGASPPPDASAKRAKATTSQTPSAPTPPLLESSLGFATPEETAAYRKFVESGAGFDAITQGPEAVAAILEPQLCAAQCSVKYGDTDSIMPCQGVTPRAMAYVHLLGLKQEIILNILFVHLRSVEQEYENTYVDMLLMNKKRYAVSVQAPWEAKPPEKLPIKSKGTEDKRRDSCVFVQKLMRRCYDFMFHKRDIPAMEAYIKEECGRLARGDVSCSEMVISMGLTKDMDNYKNVPPHVALARKMRTRDPATAPRSGDRIQYVLVQRGKKDLHRRKDILMRDCAEDPAYAMKHNMQIDYKLYMDRQVEKRITRIVYHPLGGDPDRVRALFHGAHTRVRQMSMPSNSVMAKWVKKTGVCRACGVSLHRELDGVCTHAKCRATAPTLLLEVEGEAAVIHAERDRLWTACATCVAATFKDPKMCKAIDCTDFYYPRQEADKKATDIEAKVEALRRGLADIEDLGRKMPPAPTAAMFEDD